ncbi:MAG TPA: hypothetical protein VGQ20_17625 [Acidimicrobiales bacterium]|jgi:hypothetical protein|nr:hypothetical protein [Acidimicrobiales bacterium]
MRVIQITATRNKPGRLAEGLALAADARRLLRRLGAIDLRVFQVVSGGAGGNNDFISTASYPNFAAFGRAMSQLPTDTDAHKLLEQVDDERSPVVVTHQSLAIELPVGAVGEELPPNSIAYVQLMSVRPGRYADALAFADEVAPVLADRGVPFVRCRRALAAGALTDTLSVVCGFDSWDSYGRLSDELETDTRLQEIMNRAYGADSPTQTTWSGLIAEMQL